MTHIEVLKRADDYMATLVGLNIYATGCSRLEAIGNLIATYPQAFDIVIQVK